MLRAFCQRRPVKRNLPVSNRYSVCSIHVQKNLYDLRPSVGLTGLLAAIFRWGATTDRIDSRRTHLGEVRELGCPPQLFAFEQQNGACGKMPQAPFLFSALTSQERLVRNGLLPYRPWLEPGRPRGQPSAGSRSHSFLAIFQIDGAQ